MSGAAAPTQNCDRKAQTSSGIQDEFWPASFGNGV
jgi:hypothetical protein